MDFKFFLDMLSSEFFDPLSSLGEWQIRYKAEGF